jgi:exopolysaccharide biosynthesis predicted pyruvyltransferase EpsI
MTLRQRSKLPPLSADALLICPRGGNTGDLLIADACEKFLHDRGISAWRSDGSIEDAAVADDGEYLGDLFSSYRGMLMFVGGGNIGIYPDNELIRARVVAQLGPRHRCLVFPQSAFRPEPALVKRAVTVWCRDAASEALLKDAGTRTALVPDIALYLDAAIPKTAAGSGTFYIKRTPGGDAETVEHGIRWPAPSLDLTLARPLDEIIETLRPYEFVISDRLHGGLIALMMRKKVAFLPVGYHKIKSFFDTWLRSGPGATFIEAEEHLHNQLAALRSPAIDFTALFCDYADPAFEAFLLASR